MYNANVSVNFLVEKDFIWNLATCGCENCKYLSSIIDDSLVTCDEIIEEILMNFQQILVKKI